MASEKFSVSMDGALLARIDEARGSVSRSAWLASLAKDQLDGKLVAPVGKGPPAMGRGEMSRGRTHLPTCRCAMCRPGGKK